MKNPIQLIETAIKEKQTAIPGSILRDENEKNFLLSHLDNTQKVLEYGSGMSSIVIGKKVKHLITIEHTSAWYDKLKNEMADNVNIYHILPNEPYFINMQKFSTPKEVLNFSPGEAQIIHAPYKSFKDYIEFPLKFTPFDIIFIDGAARASCASICKNLGHKNTLIFIHDYIADVLRSCEKHLDFIDIVHTTAKFKIKYW